MLSAGLRSHRVRFERRPASSDSRGNTQGSWASATTLITVWARFTTATGAKRLEAGRLEANLDGVLTVPRSTETMGITPEDRVVFTAGDYAGEVATITSAPIIMRDDVQFTIRLGAMAT